MSIWKNNPFFHVEETPDDKKQEPQQTQQPEQGGSGNTSFTRRLPSLSGNSAPTQQPVQSYTPAKQSGPDMAKFTAHFDGVLEEAKIPAPNYFTFSRMLAEMGELPDNPKYKGAFAALKSQGLTKANLISTANNYLSILDQDNQGFKQAVQDELQANNKKLQDINSSMNANNLEIERIKKETEQAIIALEQRRDTQIKQLQDNNSLFENQILPLEEASKTVNEKVSVYDTACTQYKQIIQEDLSKIQSIIN